MRKKTIILIMICIFLCCGCGKKEKTFDCKFKNTMEGNEYDIITTIKVKKDIIVDASSVIEYKEESLAKSMCEIYKVAKDTEVICNDKIITINNYHNSIAKSLEKDTLTEKEIRDYLTNLHYKCE